MKKILPIEIIKKSGDTRIFIFKNNVKIETFYNLLGRRAKLIINDIVIAETGACPKNELFNFWSEYLE